MLSLRAWAGDRRGNVAIIFAFVITVLVLCAGLAIDYAVAVDRKRSLDTALDAAVLAGAKAAAEARAAGKTDWKATGEKVARAMFETNKPNGANYESVSFQPTIVLDGTDIKAKADYTARSFTSFMMLVGKTDVGFNGAAQATIGEANFIDVHFIVDNSSSMGIGASKADQDKMYAATKCAFSCHQGFGDPSEYNPARMNALGATLRIDLVRRAIVNVIDKIKASNVKQGNVRVAIYTVSETLEVLSASDTDLNLVRQRAQTIDLNDGANGASYLSKALEDMNARLGAGGRGTSASDRLSYVVFLSDGVDDTSTVRFRVGSGKSYLIQDKLPSWRTTPSAGQPASTADKAWLQAFSPAGCASMRARGHNVLAVQIKYIAAKGFDDNPIDAKKVNYVRGPLAQPLVDAFKACGVDGYAEAADSDSIGPQLQKIVDDIIIAKMARITQ